MTVISTQNSIVVQPVRGIAHKHRMNSTPNLPFTQIQQKSAHSNPRTLLHLVMRTHAGVWQTVAAHERSGPACCVSICVSYRCSVRLAYNYSSSMRLPLPDGVRQLRHPAARGAHARHTPPHHSATITSARIAFDGVLSVCGRLRRNPSRPSLSPTEHASYTQDSAPQLRTSLDLTARSVHTDDTHHGA